MTYQVGGGNFLTMPIQEPSDYSEASNSEYNMQEVMDDGGDQFVPETQCKPDDVL